MTRKQGLTRTVRVGPMKFFHLSALSSSKSTTSIRSIRVKRNRKNKER